MYILGLGGSLHDYSACLMKDKEILVAIEEERITRQKHAADKNKLQDALVKNQVWKYLRTIPKYTMKNAVDYCLEYAKITKDDLDLVITTDSNLHLPYVNSFDHLLIMNHHMSHIASSYYASDFEDAAILVCDGRGSQITYNGEQGYESVTLAYGSKGKIKILDKVLEHSIGHFYEAVTLALGFGILEDGKVMGLSSYGNDRFVEEMGQSYVIQDGKVIFVWSLDKIKDYVKEKLEQTDSDNEFQTKADLAYAAQKNLETMVCYYADRLYKMTGCNKLCIAGGVGLNSVANGVIYEKVPFKEMFIQPAAGDNGLSIGCAMYGAYYLSHN